MASYSRKSTRALLNAVLSGVDSPVLGDCLGTVPFLYAGSGIHAVLP
jgi:hypothetical protein